MLTHFLLTRFNLKAVNWVKTREGDKVLDDAWLADRFNLFERFCLPSVLNQNNGEFYWFIFFDISTPEIFIPRIKEIEKRSKNIHCFFIDGDKELKGAVIKSIQQFLDKDCQWIITTRLDNDDMIHKDFIEEIQNCTFYDQGCYIDVPKGYQLTINKNGLEVRERYNPFSTFSSLYENVRNNLHMFSKPNHEWTEYSSKVVIDRRLWVEIVHSRNLVNDTKTTNALTRNFKFSDFGITYNWTVKDFFRIYKNKIFLRIKKHFSK